jgi:hypothetical protein
MKFSDNPLRAGQVFTTLVVTNAGRRPLTITNIGWRDVQYKVDFFRETVPGLPHELTEGKYVAGIIDEEGLRFDEILYFSAYDALGREYKHYLASWYKRAIWTIRRSLKPLRK